MKLINGIGSVIGGGDFLQGAAQGLVVYFANHLAHPDPPEKSTGNSSETYEDSDVFFRSDGKGGWNNETTGEHIQASYYNGKSGGAYALSLDGAFFGGLGFLVGYVFDSQDGGVLFFTFDGKLRYGGGVSGGGSKIVPTAKYRPFYVTDFSGNGAGYSAGAFGIGGNYGGSLDMSKIGPGTPRINPNNFGITNSKNGYITIGGGLGKPSLKLNFGATYNIGNTWILKIK